MPYKATKRLYLSVDGTRAVEEGDPQANTLLVNEGGELPLADARRYGLVQEEEEADDEPQAKALDAAPANKAVKAPEGNK
jgi:hypothetical protein